MRVGPWIRLSAEELMLSNCGAGEDLSVPWTARRSNPSILKKITPEYSLEGLMLKLKLQYSGHLMQRADSFEKTLMLGKTEDWRRRGQQRMRWLDGITDYGRESVSSESWWWTGRPGMLRFMESQRVGHNWLTELTDIILKQLPNQHGSLPENTSFLVNFTSV